MSLLHEVEGLVRNADACAAIDDPAVRADPDLASGFGALRKLRYWLILEKARRRDSSMRARIDRLPWWARARRKRWEKIAKRRRLARDRAHEDCRAVMA